MGGQFPERIALGLSTEMLRSLEKEAKRGGRTVLAQIRHFCEVGLQDISKVNDLESRLLAVEEMLQSQSKKKEQREIAGWIETSREAPHAMLRQDGIWEIRRA